MQPPPNAADLLAVVGEVLTDEIVPALRGPSQHHARVAASLVGIVERELRLGPEADEAERTALLGVLGRGAAVSDATGDDDGHTDLAELRAEIVNRLRAGMADDPTVAIDVWQALMDSVRADLRICKPGHDDWDGD